MKQRPLWLGYVCAYGAAVIFGLSWFATKQISLIADAHVFDILSIRYLLISVLILLMAGFRVIRIHLKGKQIGKLLLLSTTMPLMYNLCEYSALMYISSAEVGMISAFSTVTGALMGYFFLKEKVSAKEWIFIVVATVGVIVVNFADFDPSSESNIGRLFMLGAIACMSINWLLVRRIRTDFSPIEITSVQMVFCGVFFTAIAFVRHAIVGGTEEYFALARNTGAWPWLLFLAFVVSWLAFLLVNIGMSILPLRKTSIAITISTLVAVVSGALILREAITLQQYIGCAVILLVITGAALSKGGAEPVEQTEGK